MSATAAQPTPRRERIAVLDAWRGFALLGVILVNMVLSNDSYLTPTRAHRLPTAGLDWRLEELLQTFISDKFNTIFTFLFGIGFAILSERAAAGGAPGTFNRILIRRMLVLLGLGWIHWLLLFPGELLHVYAVCGLVTLLLIRRLSDRALAILGITLAILPRLLYVQWTYVSAFLPGDLAALWPGGGASLGSAAASAARYYIVHNGSVLDVLRNGASDALGFELRPFRLIAMLYFLGRILLGFAFWRSGLGRRLLQSGPFPRLTAGVLLTAATIIVTTSFVPFGTLGESRHFWMTALHESGIPVISAAYLLLLTALSRSSSLSWFIDAMAAVGRLSLSNYLLQSVFMFVLLYGPVLRLAGDYGPSVIAALAVAIYCLQVWLSRQWMRSHEMGPAEWAWRRLTYGTAPATRD